MIRWRADQSRAAGSCNDLRKRRPIALSSTTHTGASGTTCLRRRPAGTSFSRHGRHVNPRRPVPHRATAGTPGLLAVIRLAASPGVESSSRPRAACVAVPRAESPKSSDAVRGEPHSLVRVMRAARALTRSASTRSVILPICDGPLTRARGGPLGGVMADLPCSLDLGEGVGRLESGCSPGND